MVPYQNVTLLFNRPYWLVVLPYDLLTFWRIHKHLDNYVKYHVETYETDFNMILDTVSQYLLISWKVGMRNNERQLVRKDTLIPDMN